MSKQHWGLWNLIAGVLFTAIAGTAVLSSIGIGTIRFPDIVYSSEVAKYALLIAGILMFIDSFHIISMHTMAPSMMTRLFGLILALIGAFPLLMEHNLLTWLPFIPKMTVPSQVLNVMLLIFGIYLFINSFRLFRSHALNPAI